LFYSASIKLLLYLAQITFCKIKFKFKHIASNQIFSKCFLLFICLFHLYLPVTRKRWWISGAIERTLILLEVADFQVSRLLL